MFFFLSQKCIKQSSGFSCLEERQMETKNTNHMYVYMCMHMNDKLLKQIL